MADSKISALPDASDLVGASIPIVQGGANKKAAYTLFATDLSGKADLVHGHAIADVTNLQTSLDGKAASSHTHTSSQISDLTATATELNYTDGVTSAIQAQLDGKQPLDAWLARLWLFGG